MKKLMIAADQSVYADHVIHKGLQIAMQMHASVDIVTVIDRAESYISSATGLSYNGVLPEFRDKAIRKLEKFKALYPYLQISIMALIGDPKEDILVSAIERNVAMLIIGSGKHRDFWRVETESTSVFILQNADVPVLTIPFSRKTEQFEVNADGLS